jgi:hypothetical protein
MLYFDVSEVTCMAGWIEINTNTNANTNPSSRICEHWTFQPRGTKISIIK